MALVVFMRGVNVGSHKRFQPAVLARDLAHLDVVNVGAAGTFVVRKPPSQSALRREILGTLPFPVDLMISTSRDLLALAAASPFKGGRVRPDLRRMVTVLSKRPRNLPRLPIALPAGAPWQVEVIAIRGRFALSWWRRLPGVLRWIEPNGVLEKLLGVRSTTRNWNTLEKVCDILARSA
jgi:uncharacterized protein (DUF1697 family)